MAKRPYIVDRVAVALVAASIALTSVGAAFEDMVSGPIVALADFATTSGPATRSEIDDAVEGLGAASIARNCNRTHLAALATVRLRALELAIAAKDLPAADAHRDRAAALLRHQLRCSPGDAQAWLRLAKVGDAAAGLPAAARTRLSLSQLFAPAEGAIVAERALFAAALANRGFADLGPIVAKDLTALVFHAPITSVAKLYKVMQNPQQFQIRLLIRGTSFERKQEFESEFKGIQLNF